MTIDEAIKELEYPDWLVIQNHTLEYQKAIALSIEALKAVRERQARFPNLPHLKLLGETEKKN